jgi:hypothetical protein
VQQELGAALLPGLLRCGHCGRERKLFTVARAAAWRRTSVAVTEEIGNAAGA